nr:DUF1631 family protein [Xanthomonas theicola]
MPEALADALFRMAERAGPARNDCLEAIQLLQQQRAPIVARFRGHLTQAWQAREAGRPLLVERSLARERGDLGLVSAQELDVRLAMGLWLDFVDREGRVQPGKLSWMSPIPSRRMFVNRCGGRLRVASPEAPAMVVQLGRLRLHRDDDAFYGAMQGAVGRLERGAA